jgi:hypothetical protein
MRRVVTGALASVVLAALAALAVAGPVAADVVDDGAPGLLTIDAEPRDLRLDLDPGEHGEWLLTLRLDAETPGQLDLRITSSGVLVSDRAGLRIGIEECPVPWLPPAGPAQDASCPGAASVLVPVTPFIDIASNQTIDLGTLAADGERYLRATIAFPDPAPGELQGGAARFALGFAAAGDLEELDGSGPHDGIPPTGASAAVPFAIAALLAILGSALRVAARARGRREVRGG